VLGLTPTVRANWAFEPISIHLSYSSRISSFWAVVKCPRLEERDGTSKDITDFSPRQYCQITVTRQPDTEGPRGGLGAPPWFRLASSLPTPGCPGCPGCPGRPDCSGRPSCSHPLLPRLLAHLTALALWSLHRGKSGQSAISPRLRDL